MNVIEMNFEEQPVAPFAVVLHQFYIVSCLVITEGNTKPLPKISYTLISLSSRKSLDSTVFFICGHRSHRLCILPEKSCGGCLEAT